MQSHLELEETEAKQVDKKKSIMLIGIAGTKNDFLLALPALKCYIDQDKFVKDNTDIVLNQYYYMERDELEAKTQIILEDVKKTNPDIVAFSCYVWNFNAVKYISDKIEKYNKNIKIILGGPEISREDIVDGKYDNYNAEYLIFGEGEKPFLTLLKSIIKSDKEHLDEIRGLAYRKDNTFNCSMGSDIIENITEIPSPYLKGYISDEIFSRPEISANIETQRGCSFKCTYCFYHKNFDKIRYRDVDVVIDEIEYAYKRGVKDCRITDANFISDKDFAKKIMRGLIKRKIKMSLFFEFLPHFIDEEIAELFGEYSRISPRNITKVGIGIQTINQKSLAAIKRKIPVKFFDKAFDLLLKQNVLIKSDIILGLPYENKESYLKTIEFIAEKTRYGTNVVAINQLRILPGTDMVEMAKKENLNIDESDGNHFVTSTPWISEKEMIECLRINTVFNRLLNSSVLNQQIVRDFYFDIKDKLKLTNVELLQYFVDEFYKYLKDKNVDFVKEGFPNSELYSSRDVFNDIPDEWILFHKNWHLKLYWNKPKKLARLYFAYFIFHIRNYSKNRSYRFRSILRFLYRYYVKFTQN